MVGSFGLTQKLTKETQQDKNMDIQYAQSAVFTPSDFSFPSNGIKAEATPNTETTLIADVDIDLLKELHSFGAVKEP
jgi:predicted amidohydrolase